MKNSMQTNFKGTCAICHESQKKLFSRYECDERNLCRSCVVNRSASMTRCPKCRVDERPTLTVLLAQMKVKTLPAAPKPCVVAKRRRNVACSGGCSRMYFTHGAMLTHRLAMKSCGLEGAPPTLYTMAKGMVCCGRSATFVEALTHQTICDLDDSSLQQMLLHNYGFNGASFVETADEIALRTSPLRSVQWNVVDNNNYEWENSEVSVDYATFQDAYFQQLEVNYNYTPSSDVTYEWDRQLIPVTNSKDLYEWGTQLIECL